MEADEDILFSIINNQNNHQWKFIIAPHEIDESHLKEIENSLTVSSTRFSKANPINTTAARVLIIDNIGMLSSLYKYGTVAYIGGGFGKGIHNTLEPMAFGIPVIFGPNYQKFEEAKYLVGSGGGFSISNKSEFVKILRELNETSFYNKASSISKNYILKNQGGTQKIFELIFN